MAKIIIARGDTVKGKQIVVMQAAEKAAKKHGGPRAGAGRKSAAAKGFEKKEQYAISLKPSVLNQFKKKFGRKWGQEIENMIAGDHKDEGL